MLKEFKTLGKITHVSYGDEDRGILTCTVHVETKGWSQGFGCLALDEEKLGPSFVKDLCDTFNVKTLEEIKGKECYTIHVGLDKWDAQSKYMEGLKSKETGKKFTIEKWRKKHFPNSLSPLEERINSIKKDISYNENRVLELKKELKKLEKLVK